VYVEFAAGFANSISPPSSPTLLLTISWGADKIVVPSKVKLAEPAGLLDPSL
jgi:hypothetical protein